jgi:hypothetical protein
MRTEQGNSIPMTITDANNSWLFGRVFPRLAEHSHRAILAKPLTAPARSGARHRLNMCRSTLWEFVSMVWLLHPWTPLRATQPDHSHVAFGGGWQTTIIPVNTDAFSAAFSLNFLNEDGTPAAVPLTGGAIPSGTIQPGFSQTIETSALPTEPLRQGWAEVVSTQQIAGTAIFRQTQTNQEAACLFEQQSAGC